MKTVLVTGAEGFIGRNVREALKRRADVTVRAFDVGNSQDELDQHLQATDVIFHLAGVNRPQTESEFAIGNTGLTHSLCQRLKVLGRFPKIVFSSSIQAALDNPYGTSKREAEAELERFAADTGAEVAIYRLPNVFGKWCRPNYNSVVATFCHNIARDLPIKMSDPDRELELVYIDDVVTAFLGELGHATAGCCRKSSKFGADLPTPTEGSTEGLLALGRPAVGSVARSETGHNRELEPRPATCCRTSVPISHRVSLGQLAHLLEEFRASRLTLVLPGLSDPFVRKLYATFLSYLPEDGFAYALEKKTDTRGDLGEFLKSAHVGQLFVSRTKPGITRGNHYHDTKTEKFLVLEGDAVIRFRHVERVDVIEYLVSGHEMKVVDIPPGYTHSIENIGVNEMVVLFWSSEIFDPQRPDTYFLSVGDQRSEGGGQVSEGGDQKSEARRTKRAA